MTGNQQDWLFGIQGTHCTGKTGKIAPPPPPPPKKKYREFGLLKL